MMATNRRTAAARAAAALTVVAVFCSIATAEAFNFYSPQPSIILGSRARQYGVKSSFGWQLYAGSSFWKQRPGESDKEFFKRISQAASSPESFESANRDSSDNDSSSNNNKKQIMSAANATTANGDSSDGQQPKKKTGYQRAEDWEAEQKARRANGEMTWDERVRFEGQKQGNRFKQNEILRQNIKWGR